MARTRFGSYLRSGGALLCSIILLALAGCGSGNSSSNGSTPSISGTPIVQAVVGQKYSFTPTVQKSAGRAVSFSVQNKPAWASFSIATGQLSGTPTSADVGTYHNVVISVSNGASTVSLPAFTITVSHNGGGTATLSWTVPTTNTDGSSLTDLSGYIIDYGTSAGSLTQSVTIADPSTTSYTLHELASGTWYFAISAYTSNGAQSSLSNVVSKTIS